ncbi:MAG: amino acid ABC transporter substrate-binding protein [Acidiferrobacterales bacterium]
MNTHLAGVLVAGLTVGFPVSTAFADHRPGNVVVIGGTTSLSGRYAEPAGRYLNAWKLYVQELNERGGLLGHKVELKVLDNKSDRRRAIELYEMLITEDKVDLLLAPYSSAITDATANVMERYKRPFVAGGGSSKAIYERGRKYVFGPPRAIAQDYQQGALHIAKEIGVKRIAIIGEGSLFPRQTTKGAMEWARKLDLEVVFLESYHKDQRDFTDLLLRIKASGAEAIFSNSYFADSVAQLRQMRKLNVNVKMFAATIGPALPKFVTALGGTAELALGFSQWEPKPVLGHAGMNAFIANYEKRYRLTPNYHAALGYAEMQILEAAVKNAASFDPQKVRNAMSSVALETIMGHYKADPRGVSPGKGLTFQIQNGQRLIVWPKHLAEAKYILPMPRWDERPTN